MANKSSKTMLSATCEKPEADEKDADCSVGRTDALDWTGMSGSCACSKVELRGEEPSLPSSSAACCLRRDTTTCDDKPMRRPSYKIKPVLGLPPSNIMQVMDFALEVRSFGRGPQALSSIFSSALRLQIPLQLRPYTVVCGLYLGLHLLAVFVKFHAHLLVLALIPCAL